MENLVLLISKNMIKLKIQFQVIDSQMNKNSKCRILLDSTIQITETYLRNEMRFLRRILWDTHFFLSKNKQ